MTPISENLELAEGLFFHLDQDVELVSEFG